MEDRGAALRQSADKKAPPGGGDGRGSLNPVAEKCARVVGDCLPVPDWFLGIQHGIDTTPMRSFEQRSEKSCDARDYLRTRCARWNPGYRICVIRHRYAAPPRWPINPRSAIPPMIRIPELP